MSIHSKAPNSNSLRSTHISSIREQHYNGRKPTVKVRDSFEASTILPWITWNLFRICRIVAVIPNSQCTILRKRFLCSNGDGTFRIGSFTKECPNFLVPRVKYRIYVIILTSNILGVGRKCVVTAGLCKLDLISGDCVCP